MKKIFYIIPVCTAIFAGCVKQNPLSSSKETGTMTFNIDMPDEDYSDKTLSIGPDTKAGEAVDISNFQVTINSSTGSYAKTFLYKNIPSMLELAAGSYTVSASSSHNGGMAAWDSPEFSGSKNFDIVVGKISTVNLTCSLTNMKVTVECSDNFLNELSDFAITISQDNTSLTWQRPEVINAKEGYFPVAPLKVFISGTRAIDGSTATLSFDITNVAPKDHHILKIDARTTGDAKLQLVIDNTTNNKDVSITVPGFDEIEVPKPDDPIDPDETEAPSITWAANPDFGTMTIEEEMDVNLTVTAPGKIKKFTVTVSDNFASLVDVMGAENGVMDLINNKQLVENMGGILPTGDRLLDQTEVDFSLSTLVPLIKDVGTPGEDYTFTLYVEDALGQSLTKVCRFHNPEN